MFPYNTGGDPSFTDTCHDVLEAPGIGILCTEQHESSCGDAKRQNSRAELMRFMGARPSDMAAPTVGFTEPEDATSFAEGESFVLAVEATDNVGVVAVELWAGGQLVAADDARPYSWEVSGAPAGTYAFEVRAYDAAGNVGVTEPLELYVEGEGDTDTDTDGDGDTDGEPIFGSTGDHEDEDELPPDAALGPQAIPDSEDPFDPFAGSCDCRASTPGPSPAALMALVLLVGAARRRRA
jgi:MYXO-CTERM domain-containing protein